MPTLDTTITVSTSKEIKLQPSLRRRLLNELRAYQAVHDQIKTLERAKEKHKAAIEKVRDETGEQTLSLEGFSVCLIAPIRKKFNARKFVSLGGEIEIYNNAMEDVTSRPYTKVSVPGAKDED